MQGRAMTFMKGEEQLFSVINTFSAFKKSSVRQ